MSCVACQEPLTLDVPPDEDGPSSSSTETVPDDVELNCGCHYHWSCALSEVNGISGQCGHCSSILLQPDGRIVCVVRNEGGTEPSHDLRPVLLEEQYLESRPEVYRRAHALQDLCEAGDVEGVEDILNIDPEEDEGELDVLRYQNPLRGGATALHKALYASSGPDELVWLLLWRGATGLPDDAFPPDLRTLAGQRGLQRGRGQDIRRITDHQGRMALETSYAAQRERWASVWSV